MLLVTLTIRFLVRVRHADVVERDGARRVHVDGEAGSRARYPIGPDRSRIARRGQSADWCVLKRHGKVDCGTCAAGDGHCSLSVRRIASDMTWSCERCGGQTIRPSPAVCRQGPRF